MRIALLEDDQDQANLFLEWLKGAGHTCEHFRSGKLFVRNIRHDSFDMLILDWMVPEMDGFQVLAWVRENFDWPIPVLFLTARDDEDDIVRALQQGADDYVVKPFAFSELLARIDAICRRAVLKPSPTLEGAGLALDLTTRRVYSGKTEIILSPTEFSILELLLRNSGQVLPKRMLCEHLWESDWEGATNVIEVHINRLRNKLKKCPNVAPIETVRGRGYVLIPH